MLIELNSLEEARKLIRRSILTKDISLWLSDAESLDALLELVKLLPQEVTQPYEDVTFKFHVEGFNRSISIKEQVEIIERFSFMSCKG